MRKLKGIVLLPTLVTLGNILCGFAAVIFAARGFADARMNLAADAAHHFEIGAWCVIFGMVFDALDGRVARMTGQASKFGAELDSLCDVVTFGLAPAFLAWVTMQTCGTIIPQKVATAMCGVYAACAALRLARFNVETTLDEEAHMSFRGLPSPAAAGVVASICLLRNSQGDSPLAVWIVLALPFAVLACGLAMVSNVRYAHMVNKLLRGRRRFTRMIEVVLIAVLVALEKEMTIAFGFCAYAASGPILWVFRRGGAPAVKGGAAGAPPERPRSTPPEPGA